MQVVSLQQTTGSYTSIVYWNINIIIHCNHDRVQHELFMRSGLPELYKRHVSSLFCIDFPVSNRFMKIWETFQIYMAQSLEYDPTYRTPATPRILTGIGYGMTGIDVLCWQY